MTIPCACAPSCGSEEFFLFGCLFWTELAAVVFGSARMPASGMRHGGI